MLASTASLANVIGPVAISTIYFMSRRSFPGLVLLALVLLWERRSLASIGIAWGNYATWAIGVIVGGAILSTSVVSIWSAGRAGKPAIPADSEQGLMRVMATPLWFRSYPLERLPAMLGKLMPGPA